MPDRMFKASLGPIPEMPMSLRNMSFSSRDDEAVEGQGVVGEMGVDEELDRPADLAEMDEGRYGDGRGVADAAGVDDDASGSLVDEGPLEVGDHVGSFSAILAW